MPEVKICPKCGWALSKRDPTRRCPMCNTPFTEGICTRCGKYSYNIDGERHYCLACRNEVSRIRYAKWRRRRVYDRFDAWLELITFVKKPLVTLTEAQWLNACRYFNGCAFCESEIIDTRALFIPFKNGGKYCDWNVVPQCQKCANRRILKNNPFTSMQNYKKDRERLERIVNYLLPLLERSLE